MEQQGYFVSRCDDGTRRILYSEDIEIFEKWLEGTVEIISGVPVVCRRGDTEDALPVLAQNEWQKEQILWHHG